MSTNILEKINHLIKIADKAIYQYVLPNDELLMTYQNKIGLLFNEETTTYFKNLPYISYNGLEPLLITGNLNEWCDVLRATLDAREIGIPNNLLPIIEDNGDYYAVNLNGEVVFCSHNGPTDEKWKNIATFIHEVWINGN